MCSLTGLYVEAAEPASPDNRPLLAAEVARRPYAVTPAPALGIGDYRRAQLEADLALTPEQRVREAERTAALSDLLDRPCGMNRLLSFDTFEEYLAWKRLADLTPP